MTTTTVSPIPLDEIRTWFDDGDVVHNDRDFLDAMRAHFSDTDPRVIEVVACAANQDGQGGVDGIYRYLETAFTTKRPSFAISKSITLRRKVIVLNGKTPN